MGKHTVVHRSSTNNIVVFWPNFEMISRYSVMALEKMNMIRAEISKKCFPSRTLLNLFFFLFFFFLSQCRSDL